MFQPAIGPPKDLDDPKTYADLPQEKRAVIELLLQKVGFARVYVIAHDFADHECGRKQIERVEVLVKEIAAGFADRNPWQKPTIYWQELLYRFWDEIENMC